MSKVSIILPAYNAAHTINEALDSIPGALSGSYEVIISDDGSTDGTNEIAARHSLAAQCRVLRNSNGGPGAARNAGLAVATGDFIIFLDADDRLCPHAIDRLLEALRTQPSAVLAYGNYVNINTAGERTGLRHLLNVLPRPTGDCTAAIVDANFILNPGVTLIRRAALDRSGGFDPSLRYSQDWELWVRLALEGPFVHVPGAPVLEYRRHAQSSTASMQKTVDQLAAANTKVFNNPALRQRLGTRRFERARAARTAHMYLLLATREARHGSRMRSLGLYLNAVKACPSRIMPLTLRYGGNMLEIL